MEFEADKGKLYEYVLTGLNTHTRSNKCRQAMELLVEGTELIERSKLRWLDKIKADWKEVSAPIGYTR